MGVGAAPVCTCTHGRSTWLLWLQEGKEDTGEKKEKKDKVHKSNNLPTHFNHAYN
jgi:hypothetical protein